MTDQANEWTEAEAKTVEQEFLRKAATDREFRELALSDPRKAVEEIAHKPLPSGVTIHTVDGGASDITVVLPPLMSADQFSSTPPTVMGCGKTCGTGSCGLTST